MKNFRKRGLALALTMAMLTAAVPVTAAAAGQTDTSALTAAAENSGFCGTSAFWSLQDGVLTISGSGPMEYYGFWGKVPWDSYRSQITSVVIEDGITSLGRYAFYNCSALTSISIPASVATIEYAAFFDCRGLKSVTFADGLQSIEGHGFANCSALASVTFPDSLISIGNEAFYNCDALTSVTVPDTVTALGSRAFYDCDQLASVTIGSGVTAIEEGTFYLCHSLTHVTIGKNVTSLGDHSFRSCTKLSAVNIPAGVATIGEGAFANCLAMHSAIVPKTVTTVGTNAFGMVISTDSSTAETVSPMEDFTLSGYSGSAAETYAADNHIPFTVLRHTFTDVPADEWYSDAVVWADSKEITSGTSDTTFSPDKTCSRAEIVQLLYNQAMTPPVSKTDKFTDVASTAWYSDAVAWAVEHKITAGTSDTTFSPDKTCSRAEIVQFLYNQTKNR